MRQLISTPSDNKDMAEGSTKCSFARIAGIHYPMVYRPGPFVTPKESEMQLCEGEEPKKHLYSQQEVELLTSYRLSNSLISAPNFDSCFLEELVDMSRTARREVAIFYDHKEKSFGFKLGKAGSALELDAFRYLILFHTHPRATDDSHFFTLHSDMDLLSAYLYASRHHTAVSVVAGKVCGGRMEISIVAVEGAKVYVANRSEQQWAESELPKRVAEAGMKIGDDSLPAPKIILDPKRIAILAKNFQFPPHLMNRVRASLQRFVRESLQQRE